MIFPPEVSVKSAELEAALLSTLAFLPAMGLHILLSRWLDSAKSVRWMFASFAIYIAALIAAAQARSYDLSTWLTMLSLGGFWCLGYMEFFSMLCRGFSLGILVHLSERPGETVKEVVATYCGVGARGLMEKRLNGLVSLGFIKREGGVLSLGSATGRFIARATLVYKKLLRLGLGG